jgi:hypothetical protein
MGSRQDPPFPCRWMDLLYLSLPIFKPQAKTFTPLERTMDTFELIHTMIDLQEWLQLGNTINVFQFGLSSATFDGIVGIVGLKSEKFPINARLSGDGRRVLLSFLAESRNNVSGQGFI